MSGMCSNDPCGNGTCVNHCVHYTCNCYPGYSGSNCEIGERRVIWGSFVSTTCTCFASNFVDWDVHILFSSKVRTCF